MVDTNQNKAEQAKILMPFWQKAKFDEDRDNMYQESQLKMLDMITSLNDRLSALEGNNRQEEQIRPTQIQPEQQPQANPFAPFLDASRMGAQQAMQQQPQQQIM